MSSELTALRERVEALEKQVAELQSGINAPKRGWVAKAGWTVADEEAAEEAYRLGREFRESYRDEPESDPK